jgi:hypothetical protein
MPYAFGHITSIPDAIDQLFTIYQAAYPTDANGEAVYFWFGKELGAWSAPTTVQVIGVHPADQEPAALGPDYTREELFSIECKLTVFGGMAPTLQSFLANKNSCWAAWKALAIAVANNPTLNGVVRFAEFGELDYIPDVDNKGMTMGTITWLAKCSQRVYSLS